MYISNHINANHFPLHFSALPEPLLILTQLINIIHYHQRPKFLRHVLHNHSLFEIHRQSLLLGAGFDRAGDEGWDGADGGWILEGGWELLHGWVG